jgi:hypothetical protein
MSSDALTLIFWVDGRSDAEKVFETRASAVPRIGDQVQLGAYGGPYEWRRVTDVTWRHNADARGGVSIIVSLDATPLASGDRAKTNAKA